MQRRAATALHLALTVLGAILYFMFVLPRWWVLTGDIPTTLATAGRIAAGVPIALAAIPVVLNLRESLKTEGSTPELALRLRAWSAVLHVVAGVLIILTAVAEIWIGLDAAGPWLFAIYGAAAAIAVLGIAAFYLSRVAEKPPAEPKPPKAAKAPKPPKEKKAKRRAGKRGAAADDTVATEEANEEATDDVVAPSEAATADGNDTVVTTDIVDVATDADEVEVDQTVLDATVLDETETEETESAASTDVDQPQTGGLRNKRPTGKRRHRLPR